MNDWAEKYVPTMAEKVRVAERLYLCSDWTSRLRMCSRTTVAGFWNMAAQGDRGSFVTRVGNNVRESLAQQMAPPLRSNGNATCFCAFCRDYRKHPCPITEEIFRELVKDE
jgi:hypothetical protein